MNVNRLQPQSVQFYLTIDSCQWTIEYGIDDFIVQPTTMYEFKFNEWQEYWMKGIYRLKYGVASFTSSKQNYVTELGGNHEFMINRSRTIVQIGFQYV